MVTSGYEFTEPQNRELAGLTRLMTSFSYSLFLGGGLQALFHCIYVVTACLRGELKGSTLPLMAITLAGVMAMALALTLRGALAGFAAIIETQGSDLDHLMRALGKLVGFCRLAAVALWLLVAALAMAMVSE